ncbi:MAG: hypothetical protein V4558_07375 [Gemmatimonadota bacterium]
MSMPGRFPLLIAMALLTPFPVLAQVSRDTSQVIRSVTLDRHNIFDTSEGSFFGIRVVNALHITTRSPLIRRELLFRPGDRYDAALTAETARNLRRLGVFSTVKVDSVRTDSGLTMNVFTRDGWSTRPDFRFKSTGGSVAYTLALIEDNLLGTLTQTQLLYKKDPDRTSTILQFRKQRLIANKVGVNVVYADRSDGQLLSGVISKPYFSLATRSGAFLEFDTRRERIFVFRDGFTAPSDTLQRRYVLGRLDASRALRASSKGYLRVGAVAQLRRDDFATQGVYDVNRIPTHSVTAAFGGYVEARHADFLVVRGYQSFGRPEDVDLSTVARLSLLVAPGALGYERNGVAPGLGLHTGTRLPGGFLTGDFLASGLFTSKGLDSGQVQLAATAALLPSPRHQFLFHAEGGMLRSPLAGSEFDLGLGAGPRGFQEHAFTGDRQFFGTVEYRYTAFQEFAKVTGVGLATFVDYGGAWYHGSPRRTGWDAGVGLRLGPSRAPDDGASRLDLVRRFASDRQPAGWVFVVGKGFVFSTSARAAR